MAIVRLRLEVKEKEAYEGDHDGRRTRSPDHEYIPKCLSDILCDLKFLSLVERKTPPELSRKDKL